MSCELQGVYWRSILPIKLVATATTYEGSKNNFKSFFYGLSSTNPANFVKIDLVDVEITGLTEITIYKKSHQQNTSPPRLRFAQSGWTKKLV